MKRYGLAAGSPERFSMCVIGSLPPATRRRHAAFHQRRDAPVASQAAAGLDAADVAGGLPFALARAELLAGTTDRAWAWVRRASGNTIDIDVLDEDGRLCVRMTGLAFRPAAGMAATPAVAKRVSPRTNASTPDILAWLAAAPAETPRRVTID